MCNAVCVSFFDPNDLSASNCSRDGLGRGVWCIWMKFAKIKLFKLVMQQL